MLLATGAVRDMIRERDRTASLNDYIKASREQYGMQTFDQHLMDLVADDVVTLRAELLSEDGGEHVAGDASGPDGEALARDLASVLFERATPAIRAGFAG